jgi:hypothetical protein
MVVDVVGASSTLTLFLSSKRLQARVKVVDVIGASSTLALFTLTVSLIDAHSTAVRRTRGETEQSSS